MAPISGSPWAGRLSRQSRGEAAFIATIGAGAIALTVLANFVLTEGRAAAAFAQPVAYARSFFNRDAVASYGPEDSAGARVISIQIDAETGERRIDTLQLQSAPAAALRPDVMGAAAQDSMGALGAPRVQPSATPTRTAVPSGAPRQP